MQSFTTQSHERNYQGNVVLPATQSRKKRRKGLMSFATSIMALAVAVMGGLWGATAVHNYQLKHQVQEMATPVNQSNAVTEDVEIDHDQRVYPAVTLESYPDEPVADNEKPRTYPRHKKRYQVQPLPAKEYDAEIVHND